MSKSLDMFLLDQIEARRRKVIDTASELFNESIQHAHTENPHMHFWLATLGSRSSVLFYNNQPDELRTWCKDYIDELIAWLQLNYLDPKKFYSTGAHPQSEHVLTAH